MNEVEKMYENAGVKKINTQYANNVSFHLVNYPPFTAKKQLELIKWLANKKLCISSPQAVNTYVDKFWHIGINPFNFKLDMVNEPTFEECLARLVNYIWQELTEEERKQIRGILE